MKSQTHKGGGRRGKGGGGRGKGKESLRQEVHSFSYYLIFNTVQHRRLVRIIKQLSTFVSNCCTRVSVVASSFLSFFLFFSPFFHDNKTSKQKEGSMTMPEEDLEALYNPDIHFKSWRQGIPSTIPIALHLSWENPGIFISSPLLSSLPLSLSLSPLLPIINFFIYKFLVEYSKTISDLACTYTLKVYEHYVSDSRFQVLNELFALNDSARTTRVHAAMEPLLNHIKCNTLTRNCEGVQYLMLLVREDEIVRQWLVDHVDIWLYKWLVRSDVLPAYELACELFKYVLPFFCC